MKLLDYFLAQCATLWLDFCEGLITINMFLLFTSSLQACVIVLSVRPVERTYDPLARSLTFSLSRNSMYS